MKLGGMYFGFLRKLLWMKMRKSFARSKQAAPLPHQYTSHKTPLMRKLKDVDMWLQENKVVNLRIAAKQLNGIIVRPGEVFSYWKIVGKPSARKGYLPGMVLQNGGFCAGTGGAGYFSQTMF